jgi:hypothetical protein
VTFYDINKHLDGIFCYNNLLVKTQPLLIGIGIDPHHLPTIMILTSEFDIRMVKALRKKNDHSASMELELKIFII